MRAGSILCPLLAPIGPLLFLDRDIRCRRALRSGAKRTFPKLDSDLHWTAPNYPTGSKSSCAVEGQIECFWNASGADHYQAGPVRGDVSHHAIGGASVSKQFGRFENPSAVNMSSFLHGDTIAATN
jgi:hypothetical protein